MSRSTLRDSGGQGREEVRLLTYVLSYDDLLHPKSQTFQLYGVTPVIHIGRGEGTLGWSGLRELKVPDPFLSSRHVSIEFNKESGNSVLRDLGSTNGSYINGNIAKEEVLEDGDLIEIGHSLFVYRQTELRAMQALDALDKRNVVEPLPALRTICPEVALLGLDLLRICPTKEPVLVLGETGTGKEVCANAVHILSKRRGSFQAVDCGAIPEGLFESTFFGHERGAFTGATTANVGAIQRADQGTLFLDEVGNLPPSAQAKLLRTLEDNKVLRVGGSTPKEVDVRWVAATNRELFGDGEFRNDLLRRLSGYVVRLLPLRKRREDLGLLTAALLGGLSVEQAAITAPAGRMLFSSSFPGNIRELRAALRSAALLADSNPITPVKIDVQHLPLYIQQGRELKEPPVTESSPAGDPARAKALRNALEESGGVVSLAAEILGISRRHLYRELSRHHIKPTEFRKGQ